MINENFINEWIKHHEDTYDDDDVEIHWTDDYLLNLMLKGEFDELWAFVLQTYRKDLSQAVIGILAAGELEDILASKGEEFIGRVELLATNDKKFKYLLGGVWQNSMSSEVWSRLCVARGEAW